MAEKILVVDDEVRIRKLLRNCLEPEGYEVFEAENSDQIDDLIAAHPIDLITLDLNLGRENGLVIAQNLRTHSDIPIIIVTGKGDVIDAVVGLEVGADDYIAKPFHIREVIARVRSVLRRTSGRGVKVDETGKDASGDPTYRFDGWIANPATFALTDPNNTPVELTTTDFKLLMVFLKAPKRVLSRDQIMDYLNGGHWAPNDRTIDNQVARLRKKLEIDPTKPAYIKTVRGIGYTFAANVQMKP